MDPYVGEIRMFGGDYCPEGWAICDGSQLSIASYSVLYSLLGTTYGGDGISNFNLPDLRGRLPMHMGPGPGLTNRALGTQVGTETVALTTDQLPSHNHLMTASGAAAVLEPPTSAVPGAPASPQLMYVDGNASATALNSGAIQPSGLGQAHDNVMPSTCINFIISLAGIYPERP